MEIGYFLSSEDTGPKRLVELAKQAEQAGFGEVMISDHFHPWIDRQGHSPFVWSIIGAIAESTSLTVTTGVTCPTVRVHPVINAQAVATATILLGGRFRFGVGSGENLNEHIVGVDWPDADTRLDMLEEAVAVIRSLWTGDVVSHHGPHYTVRNARIYDVPDELPPILVSGFGPKATELAGRIGDGFVNTAPNGDLVKLFEDSGGRGKLKVAGGKVCYGDDEKAAAKLAHELWPNAGLPGELAQELPSPQHFKQASSLVSVDKIAESIPVGNDPERFVQSFKEYEAAGFDILFVQQIGDDQAGFFDFFRHEVEPRL